MDPIGVGFLDLNPEGLFHLERFCWRADFRCVAGWNASGVLPGTHGRIAQPAASAEAVLEDPRISLVWTGPQTRLALAAQVLTQGKSLLMGLPVGWSSQDWQALCLTAARSRSHIYVAALHRWDGPLRTTRDVVGSGSLGPLTALHRISWQYVPAELSTPGGTAAEPTEFADRRKWFQWIDELLLLVAADVTGVSVETPVGTLNRNPTGRAVQVQFAGGCTARLELNRRSLAPLETGWVLNGTLAGLADGKRFEPVADYELVDVPVLEQATDHEAFYDALAGSIQNGKKFPVTTDEIASVLDVLERMRA